MPDLVSLPVPAPPAVARPPRLPGCPRRSAGLAALLGLMSWLPARPALTESALVLRAEQAYRDGQYRRAVELLRAQVHRTPNDAQVHLRLAEAYLAAGERERALIEAAEASDLDRRPVQSWLARVSAALAAGEHRKALLGALELARLNPEDCSSLRLAAELERSLGDAHLGLGHLQRAALRCPMDPATLVDLGEALLEAGCASEALGVLLQARLLPGSDPQAEQARLRALARVEGRFAAADRELAGLEEQVSEILAASPDARPPARLGSSELDLRWRSTLQLVTSLAGPESPDPDLDLRLAELYRIGHMLGVDGSLERSRLHAERALGARPWWPEILVLLGSLDLTQEPPRPEAAARRFRDALAVAGPDPLPSAWSGLFFAYLGLGRYRVAVEAADRYLGLVPEDRDLRALRDAARARIAQAPPGDR